jgi:hypothetical protein
MALCPHCSRNTINYFAKFESWRGGPVKCRECGGLSFFPGPSASWKIVGGVAGATLIPILILVTIITWSLWAALGVLAAFVALVISYEVALYRKALIPITADEVAESRRWSRKFAAVLLVVSGVALLIVVGKYVV